MKGSARSALMVAAVVMMLMMPRASSGQAQIPPPSGPVAFCGVQATPEALSYALVLNGAAPEPLDVTVPGAPATPLKTFCDANAPGWTHAFSVAAARFPLGSHTVVVRGTNPFGTTSGPAFTLTVGIAPGQFTITAVGQLPPE